MSCVVLVTGGFDPIHSGHIELLNEAKTLGDILLVGVNSDSWLIRKKGRAFMPIHERMNIVANMKSVGYAFDFDDEDGSAIDAIRKARALFPNSKIIFANGGDRTAANIPELAIKDDNLIFKFGVGGENKMNSSSWILNEWKAPKVERPWGYYRVLYDNQGTKVKELTVNPNSQLSMQRHFKRSEYWQVVTGQCKVYKKYSHLDKLQYSDLSVGDEYYVPLEYWHQLTNPYDKPCSIIEIQHGEECIEEDIERWE